MNIMYIVKAIGVTGNTMVNGESLETEKRNFQATISAEWEGVAEDLFIEEYIRKELDLIDWDVEEFEFIILGETRLSTGIKYTSRLFNIYD